VNSPEKYFLPYQAAWIRDPAPMKLMQKSRQVGISFADAFDSVLKAATRGARHDVWVSSRDETQAKLYLEDCRNWARILQLPISHYGYTLVDEDSTASFALKFTNGRRIHCVSSNPNALAGKRGHVKLDEFALHPDQRLLYRAAKPVTQWGGTLSIISTHRGVHSVFNDLVRGILERGNPMGWSLHTVPLQRAVEEGIVERINRKTGRSETRQAFLARVRAECLDEEQWLQEYCCVPSDDSSGFFSAELLRSCEAEDCLKDFAYLLACRNPLYLGVDVARRHDLCVLDVGERIGDVMWDRLRIELRDRPFSDIETELYRLLDLPELRRACIDATGMGMQLAERARERCGWTVEPVHFTAAVKEELAYGMRADLECRRMRISGDRLLQADLLGLKKVVTLSGNIRLLGDGEDSHSDRAWAKALRQHAARNNFEPGAMVG
jgi:phage FluMu gp28-like protein